MVFSVALWGGAIELLQPLTNRKASIVDFAAIALGTGLGAAVGTLLRRALDR